MKPAIVGFLSLPALALAGSRYIVQLKPEVTLNQLLESDDQIQTQNHLRPNVIKTISIGETFKCFVAELEDSKLEDLKVNSFVYDILPDFKVGLFADEPPKENDEDDKKGPDDNDEKEDDGVKVQNNAPTHLARISSKEPLYLKTPPYEFRYGSTGKGVVAYVVDNGVDVSHPDFEGRATIGNRFEFTDIGRAIPHGTHVAGLIGSKTFGVAKDVELVDVQVFSARGSGPLSGILEGLEFVVNDHVKRNYPRAVVNLSLGSLYNGILNDATTAVVQSGLAVIVAAGNDGLNTRYFSPASADGVISVAAFDATTDIWAPFSNYGRHVAVIAPGVKVYSLGADNVTYLPQSGTSMASPIVAGIAATFLEEGVPAGKLRDKLIDVATLDAVTFTPETRRAGKKTHNRLAYNTYGKSLGDSSPASAGEIKPNDIPIDSINTVEKFASSQPSIIEWSRRSAKIRGIDLEKEEDEE